MLNDPTTANTLTITRTWRDRGLEIMMCATKRNGTVLLRLETERGDFLEEVLNAEQALDLSRDLLQVALYGQQTVACKK